MLIIDNYAYTNRLSKTNPVLKTGLVLISLLLTTTVNNNYINTGIMVLMVFLTIKVAGIPLKNYIKVLSIPLGFLILSMVTILLSISKEDIFIMGFRLFNIYIGITPESIFQSIRLFTRTMGALCSTFFLGLTTPLNHIIKVFKKIGVPNTIIEIIVLVYRFIFIFLEEANEIYNAQNIRFGYLNIKNSYKSISLLIRSLFIRVLLKYQDMVVALECKLYNGEFKIGD